MKNKVIKAFAVISMGLALTGTSTVILSTSKVSAVSDKTIAKYARKFHRVVVTEPMQVYKVHRGKYGYLNRYTKAYKLRPGDTAQIQYRGVEWAWTIGKSYKYCTLRGGFSWFDTYSKYKWIDKGLLDGKFKDENFCYRFTWKQYRKLCSLNVLNNDYFITKKDWRTKIKPLIEKWKPTTGNF